MRGIRLGATWLWVALAAGCGSVRLSVGSALVDIGSRIAAIHAEDRSHAQEIANAPTLGSMQPLEESHRWSVEANLSVIEEDLAIFQACMDPHGSPPDVSPMRAAMKGVRSECDRHLSAMGRAPDAGTALGEERRHQLAMQGWLDEMTGLKDAWMGQAGRWDCSGTHDR